MPNPIAGCETPSKLLSVGPCTIHTQSDRLVLARGGRPGKRWYSDYIATPPSSAMAALEDENAELKRRVQRLEAELSEARSRLDGIQPSHLPTSASPPAAPPPRLVPEEYRRYGRQMIMPEIGLEGTNIHPGPWGWNQY